MAALPQAYAGQAELQRTDALRDSANNFTETQPQQNATQQAPTQHQRQMSQSVRLAPRSRQAGEQLASTFSGFQSQSALDYQHRLRPQSGIAPVPKHQQAVWQQLLAKGPARSDLYKTTLAAHLPSTERASGHADGPQRLPCSTGTLPDANHRQALSQQPTFTWFRRSDYSGVPDRWSRREGMLGRGDNYYRPKSVTEQLVIQERVDRRRYFKGAPRTGEW
jgi:hypothetical protein